MVKNNLMMRERKREREKKESAGEKKQRTKYNFHVFL